VLNGMCVLGPCLKCILVVLSYFNLKRRSFHTMLKNGECIVCSAKYVPAVQSWCRGLQSTVEHGFSGESWDKASEIFRRVMSLQGRKFVLLLC